MEPPPAPRRDPARILGCPVDELTMQGALDWCLDACRAGGPPRIVLTANASHLVATQDDAGLRNAAEAADLVTADGMSLVWAGRLLGWNLPERVTGIDLMDRLLQAAPGRGLRVFFLGARPAVLERFLAHCRTAYPGLEVAGARDGYFGPEDHAAVVRQVAESGADMLFVAMPSPFKDIWCERYRDRLGVPLIMGVGGAFDVMAGVVRRAPVLMQRAGLEWAWRLMLEPRRLWRRYLAGNSRFVWLVLREALGRDVTLPARVRAEAPGLLVRTGGPAGTGSP
ncbi:WecB/TagA/CpsF family glycosyltransferase [Falsiroseomonas sp. CW058]|uniref:WecB/TagA/CpsF family glycosyltransferase n=1 Tax=Falsiroseomonas sp. CW058 TaxID=3388664 RepID=UPI003D32042F